MQVLLRLIPKQGMERMPLPEGLGLNVHLVLFTAAIAVLATVLFAVTPLVRLPTRELHDGLSEGGRGAAGTAVAAAGSEPGGGGAGDCDGAAGRRGPAGQEPLPAAACGDGICAGASGDA